MSESNGGHKVTQFLHEAKNHRSPSQEMIHSEGGAFSALVRKESAKEEGKKTLLKYTYIMPMSCLLLLQRSDVGTVVALSQILYSVPVSLG